MTEKYFSVTGMTPPFLDAGLDVQNVDGWVFLVMPGKDGTSSNLLVKPVDLG